MARHTIGELATLVRSKNAGPFLLTFDILFDSEENFERVRRAGILTRRRIADIYRCAPEDVRIYECPNALAVKATIPRPAVQGRFGDPDLHGCQQHAPLCLLVVES
ncbi:DUF4387 domain-containing protein [Actinophytocola sp.]|uniref:DUF4387 domain-containing protein n=1 Tax=Actinophytocola sp. TaxID=1872138 RepID=UPI003D6B5AFB